MAVLVYNALLTAFALGLRPVGLVADQIFPTVRVPTKNYRVLQGDKKAIFARRDTYISKLGLPNEVIFDDSFASHGVKGEALITRIDNTDISEYSRAGMQGNLEEGRLSRLYQIMAMAKEFRTADLVGTVGNYPAAHRITPATKWDNAAAVPQQNIQDLIETPLVPANTLIFMGDAWQLYAAHEQTLADLNPRDVKAAVSPARAAEFWRDHGITNLVIARAKYDTAAKGKAAVRARIYTTGVVAAYIDPAPASGEVQTFGATATLELEGTDGQGLAVFSGDDTESGVTGARTIKLGRVTDETIFDSELGAMLHTLETG